jgi:hypothetical protein
MEHPNFEKEKEKNYLNAKSIPIERVLEIF